MAIRMFLESKKTFHLQFDKIRDERFELPRYHSYLFQKKHASPDTS